MVGGSGYTPPPGGGSSEASSTILAPYSGQPLWLTATDVQDAVEQIGENIGGATQAVNVSLAAFSGQPSWLTATDVQNAIQEFSASGTQAANHGFASYSGQPSWLTATDVQDAIQQVAGEVAGVATPAAGAVTYTPPGTPAWLTATDVQSAITQVADNSGGSPSATAVSFSSFSGEPAWLTATDVQHAIQQVSQNTSASAAGVALVTWTGAPPWLSGANVQAYLQQLVKQSTALSVGKVFIPPTFGNDSSRDDQPAIQAFIDANLNPGDQMSFAINDFSGINKFYLKKPIRFVEGVVYRLDNCEFFVHGSAVAANWQAQAIWTSKDYLNDAVQSSTQTGTAFRGSNNTSMSDNGTNFGSGIILCSSQAQVSGIDFESFGGSEVFNPSVNGQPTGHGYGIIVTCAKYSNTGSGNAMTANLVTTIVERCRIQSNNSNFLTYESATNAGSITDGFFERNILLAPKSGWSATTPTVYIKSGGGWSISFNHSNHVLSDLIVLGGAVNTRIIGNYLDGWGFGTSPGGGATNYCINLLMTPGSAGGGNAVIANNTIRYKAGPASGNTLVGIRIKPLSNNAPAYSAVIANNDAYVETTQSATAVAYDLVGVSGTELDIVLSGNHFRGITDADTFSAGSFANNVVLVANGNWFQQGGAAPAAGNWQAGIIRYLTTPAVNGSEIELGFVCTVSGKPGTWKAFGVTTP